MNVPDSLVQLAHLPFHYMLGLLARIRRGYVGPRAGCSTTRSGPWWVSENSLACFSKT